MTYKEKYMKEHPDRILGIDYVIQSTCPPFSGGCPYDKNIDCTACWNQEIPEEPNTAQIDFKAAEERLPNGVDVIEPSDDAVLKFADISPHLIDKLCEVGNPNPVSAEELRKIEQKLYGSTGVSPKILDSGNRRQFESGAVRDIQEGKGRCDLLPLNVIGSFLDDPIFALIEQFQETGNLDYLFAVFSYTNKLFPDKYTMILEISKHFEEGCKKYGENNWRKGIPAKCYVDSAVRHYLKWLRGDKDEPHDRAFVWNVMCCIWTCQNKPDLNSYLHISSEEK